MEYHEIASVLPLMVGDAYERLKADIKKNGVRESVWLFEGKLLDGRNRDRACTELGMPLPMQEYTGIDPLGFSLSVNLHRRHLNESQRAMTAARLATLLPHRPKESAQICALTQDEAADLMGVSRRGVQMAKQVLASGDEELIGLIDTGELTVNAVVTVLAKRANSTKLDEIAKLDPGDPDKRYHVVVVDPPWPMHKIEREVRPNQAGLDYPSMSVETIAQLEIPALDDCHLWLWTTHRFLPAAITMVDMWGFTYVCTFVWHKPGGPQPINLPQYNCEFAIYARRGAPTFIDTKGFPTCFEAPRTGHSEKPEAFYEMVARVTEAPRIDMFSRRAIEGFDGWGQESADARLAG